MVEQSITLIPLWSCDHFLCVVLPLFPPHFPIPQRSYILYFKSRYFYSLKHNKKFLANWLWQASNILNIHDMFHLLSAEGPLASNITLNIII